MYLSQILLTGMIAALSVGSPIEIPSSTPTINSATTTASNLLVASWIDLLWVESGWTGPGIGPVSTNIPAVPTTTANRRRQLVPLPISALWGNNSAVRVGLDAMSINTPPTTTTTAADNTTTALLHMKTPIRHANAATTTIQDILVPTTKPGTSIPVCFDRYGNGYKGYYYELRHFSTREEARRVKEATIGKWLGRGYPGGFVPRRSREVVTDQVVLLDDGSWAFGVTLAHEFFSRHIVRGGRWEDGWLAKIVQREMGFYPEIVQKQFFWNNACWDPARCEIDGGTWVSRVGTGRKMCMRPCEAGERAVMVSNGKLYCNAATFPE